MSTLSEDQRTFMTISREILFRMKNFSDTSCRGNQNTHFTLNALFPEIRAVYVDRPHVTM
jgi:hypothetical protein